MRRFTLILPFTIQILTGLLAAGMLASCSTITDSGILVSTIEEFDDAVAAAVPGDKIVLQDGVWLDTELMFEGQGTEDSPITLSVETKGGVILSGQSNLKIAGEYLVVEGLVFKDGYTPTSEVISFRRNKQTLATHCRVTECVIDRYNNPERFETDLWVGIYGKHNRFDHNYLVGKGNRGVTLAVRLDTEESRENFHRIDHNYFGQREILGSNGGETLRIGTSHYSLTNSNTLVEANFFDRCNGEHEIISNKSCQNTFKYNTFFECQGTLTMRHGNETLVESNFFFGNGKVNTGGIRIINETQTVINNYCVGLTGYRFRGGFVIMNGVPNSPLNRYFQVKDSKASNNTFIDCDHIQLCAGSDKERSAVPINTTVSNNLFLHSNKKNLFTVYDDISGITFEGNTMLHGMSAPTEDGFVAKQIPMPEDGEILLYPGVGITSIEDRATAENTGVSWYPKVELSPAFERGNTRAISPGENTLLEAIKTAEEGDVLSLEPGEYLMTKSIDLDKTISIQAVNPADRPVLLFERTSLFNIEEGGALSLRDLIISGAESPDQPGNAVIRTSRYSMIQNYTLKIDGCEFRDLDVNHSFDVLKVFRHTFADSITLTNSTFSNITGSVLSLNKETDDIGIYNVEQVVIDSCTFEKVGQAVLDLYRGGLDESTFGPMLTLNHSSFENVGKDKRNKTGSSVTLHGVQVAQIGQNTFASSTPLKLHLVVGEPIVNIEDCLFEDTPVIQDNGEPYHTSNLIYR